MTLRSTFLMFSFAALLCGCQNTSIRSAWFDTDFSGPPLRKIAVVGSAGGAAGDRLVEDIFVTRLQALGVEAVAGHAVRLDDPALTDASFEAGVQGTGAQGLLLVHLLGVETRTQVSTTMVHGGMGWGRGPWGGSTWGGGAHAVVPVQQVTQSDIATVETKLFDVKSRQLLWAATTSTFNPRSVASEAPAFADLIIGELVTRGIIERK